MPIVGMSDIIAWMERKGDEYATQLVEMKKYRETYGAEDL